MYRSLPYFVLGFHGCDRNVAERVLAGKDNLKHSENDYGPCRCVTKLELRNEK
jgi:hypothetical protein